MTALERGRDLLRRLDGVAVDDLRSVTVEAEDADAMRWLLAMAGAWCAIRDSTIRTIVTTPDKQREALELARYCGEYQAKHPGATMPLEWVKARQLAGLEN